MKLGEFLLALVAVLFLAGGGYWLYRDVTRTAHHVDQERAADAIAKADLALAQDPKQGWFPAPRDPIHSWDTSDEGWQLETERSLALEPLDLEEGTPEQGPRTAPPQGPETGPNVRPDAEPQGGKLELASPPGGATGKCLAVPVNFPDAATIFRVLQHGVEPMAGVRFIAYDVYLPAEARGHVGCLFFIKDKDGLWYQARSKAGLTAGAWTTVTADLRGNSPDVEPLGHTGQWDENQASQASIVGMTFHGDRAFEGTLYVDNFRGWLTAERYEAVMERVKLNAYKDPQVSSERRTYLLTLEPDAGNYTLPPLALLNYRLNVEAPTAPAPEAPSEDAALPVTGRYQTVELAFELNRQFSNPFDPRHIDVQAQVDTPSGRHFTVYGFWNQDYEARDRFEREELEPLGRPDWRVRFTPRETGVYTVTLKVKAGSEELAAPPRQVRVVPSNLQGLIRTVKLDPNKKPDPKHPEDPYYFEYDNGDYYYPVGHNLHSPIDLRCWKEIFHVEPPLDRGLKMYADFFPKMQAAGENAAEVWMASWWLGIEWTKRWRGFHGAGRYNLGNAWKLDRLFEMAKAHGISLHLVIDNHGKFSSYCDPEWEQNPYNRRSDADGWLVNARDFFTDDKARDLHKQRLRYIAARWGAETNLIGFELVSEMDLVGGGNEDMRKYYRTPPPRNWVREMIAALRSYDAHGHAVTCHYSGDFNVVDRELADTPIYDYIVGDAYRQEPGYFSMALANSRAYERVNKPFWITEFGGDWNATSIPRLHADLHCGLWSTWMTNAAGTPLLWWYDFIDRKELYTHYRAFTSYIKGEDKRAHRGRTMEVPISAGGDGLQGLRYTWPAGAYVWVYNAQAMREMPEMNKRPRHEGVVAHLDGLWEGTYSIEYWDTYDGKIVHVDEAKLAAGQQLELKFPPFLSDMAVKVIKK